MKFWSDLQWRWKLPIIVITLQLMVMVWLPKMFPSSTSDWIKVLYLLAGYPFLGSWRGPMAWVMVLWLCGIVLDRKTGKIPKPSRG